jgi:hypothetical protein
VHFVEHQIAGVHDVGMLKMNKCIAIGMARAKVMPTDDLVANFYFPFIGKGDIGV